MPKVTNDVRSAMPVTTPGRAIGRTRKNEIVWRPKKRIALDGERGERPEDEGDGGGRPLATISELTTAARTLGLPTASPNQWSVKPVGGHAWMRLGLKA